MDSLDRWGAAYLRLGLRLDKHFPGYVDAYYGPEQIRAAVEAEETLPATELVQQALDLQQDLPARSYPPRRALYLGKQLRAIEAVARKIAGEALAYRQEVERCFDISPQLVPEEQFEAAHRELDRALPGEGSLLERLQAYRDRFVVPEEQVLPLINRALAELRRRTQALFPLPEGETVEVSLVRDQPWAAYNWYMGHYRSKIELNVDLPTRAHGLLELFAHEAYPGHHTEAAIKEALLYQGQGFAEQSIALLNTPDNVIAEGIGNMGVSVLLEDRERFRWKNDQLYPLAGLEPVDPEQALRIERASKGLRFLSANAALLLHEQGWSAEQTLDYIEQYGLRPREEAEHSLRFIQSPLFRAYVFCYATGEVLIERAMAQVGDRQGLFRRLLTEPWVPSALADLAGQGQD